MNTTDLIKNTKYYLDAGINAMPIYLGTDSKGQRVEDIPLWKKFTTKKITPEQVEALANKTTTYFKQKPNGIAVISGPISGNLSCLDIDLKNTKNKDFSILSAIEGLKYHCEEFFDDLVIEETWSGGLHVFFRTQELSKKSIIQLAKSKEGSALIEIFHFNKIIYVHPTPNYKIIQGDIDNIPVLTNDQLANIYEFSRTWDRAPLESETKKYIKKSKQKTVGNDLFEITPWDAFNEQHSPMDILINKGWSVSKENDKHVILTRPGEGVTNAKSAIYEKERNNIWVLTTSVPGLQQHQQYDAYKLVVNLDHDGKWDEAWRTIEKQGYGKRNPNAKHIKGRSAWEIIHNYLIFDQGVVKNELTGEIEINGNVVDEEMLNSFYIDLIEYHPKVRHLNNQNFWLFIRSTKIPSYHPFKQFVEGNERRSNVSQIDKLLKCIEPYDEFTSSLLRKWLIGIIANIFGDKFPSIIGPVLYGPPNTGKSTFFERLLPEEFHEYFSIHDAEDKLDSNDSKTKMVRNALVLFDEFRFAKKIDARQFRTFISAPIYDYREPYARKSKKRRRVASWCAATNYDDFITESENNRRMIPILVKSINFELQNSVDRRDLLIEMYECWKDGEAYLLDKKEVAQLIELSKENEPVTVEQELIEKFFRPPSEEDYHHDRIENFSATDVKQFIEKKSDMRLPYATARNVGVILKKIGFEQKKVRVNGSPTRMYEMVQVEDDQWWDTKKQFVPGPSSEQKEIKDPVPHQIDVPFEEIPDEDIPF